MGSLPTTIRSLPDLSGWRDGLIAFAKTRDRLWGTLSRQMVAVEWNQSRGSLG